MARQFDVTEADSKHQPPKESSAMKPVEYVRSIFELTVPFDGLLRRKLAAPVKSALERLLLLRKLDQFYAGVARRDSETHFTERVLEALDVSYGIGKDDSARIPGEGPLVVVANHPMGIVDGVILASIVRSVRSDFKLLANSSLSRITELCDTLIPVDPYGKFDSIRANTRPVREAIAWLRNGGVLGVFPAGEVAHINFRECEITDPKWNASIARIIRKAGAPVLPVFFEGSNSVAFQLAGLIDSRFRTALLPREFLNKRGKNVEVKIGSLIPFERLQVFENDCAMIDYLRRRTYLLTNRCSSRDRGEASPVYSWKKSPVPIVSSSPAEAVAEEIRALPPEHVLLESYPYTVFCTDADQIPKTLREIGRLREITFRRANEGTGKEIDLDEFDSHYAHLFLWNGKASELVGAYRVGKADEILSRSGTRGLYTHTLFDYDANLLDRINPALELGRAFVRPEYQKTFPPLFLLWKGIAQFVARCPQYKMLFGPVSISSNYKPIARRFIVDCLSGPDYRHELADLVKARNPFRGKTIKDRAFRVGAPLLADIEDVSALISDIETDRKGIPVLLKQYLKLGGKLLGFNIDQNFNDALDGLILVDLTLSNDRMLSRLMGDESASRFLEFHGRRYLLAS